jgi:hypothetical protein
MDSQKADVDSSPSPVPRRLGNWWSLALLVGLGWWGFSLLEGPAKTLAPARSDAVSQALMAPKPGDGPEMEVASGSGVATTGDPVPLSPEQQVLGVWRDFYRGERTLTLNGDGTGTMVVRLAGVAKKLFAETLEFDLAWEFEDGQLVMSTVAGRPASKFEVIRKLYGDRADYEVLEITPDQMRLRDAGGKTEYDWRRPEKLYEDVALDDQSGF